MHCPRACNIHAPHPVQESLLSPNPVSRETIDQCIQKRKHNIGDEFGSLGHGTGHDRCCRRCERHLEDEPREDPAHIVGIGVYQEVTYPTKPIASGVSSESEAKTESPECYTTKDDVHGVFHHDVHFVFDIHTSRFQESETFNKDEIIMELRVNNSKCYNICCKDTGSQRSI